MIVDAHTHLLPDRLALAIRRWFDEHLTDRVPWPYAPQLKAARQALLEAGVERAWSLPYAHRPQMASALNRSMAELFADDALIIPGATLHVEDDVQRVLDEALGELRLRVVKLHCAVGRFAADDPRLDPLWRRVSADGQPVVVHAGLSPDGRTAAIDLEPISRAAKRWPDARIVLAHCGAPATARALELLAEHRSLHADLTPVVHAVTPISGPALEPIADRILFGSDAPNTRVRIEDAMKHVRELGLSASSLANVLGDNAKRLVPA